jgi:hypothetical protein
VTHTHDEGQERIHGTMYGIRPHLPMTEEKARLAEQFAHMPLSPEAVRQLAAELGRELECRPETPGGDGLGYGNCVACGELWPCAKSRGGNKIYEVIFKKEISATIMVKADSLDDARALALQQINQPYPATVSDGNPWEWYRARQIA